MRKVKRLTTIVVTTIVGLAILLFTISYLVRNTRENPFSYYNMIPTLWMGEKSRSDLEEHIRSDILEMNNLQKRELLLSIGFDCKDFNQGIMRCYYNKVVIPTLTRNVIAIVSEAGHVKISIGYTSL